MKGESRNALPFSWKSISDRRERIIGAVRHRRNSGLLANRRAYRLIVTFKVWGEEFPSMILNFLSDSTMKREASATRRAQNSLSKMVASFEQGDKYAETVTKAVTDGATQAVEETVQAGTKAIDEVAKKSAKSIEKLEQAANARAKRFMRITKPEVMVNIAIWIAVAVASAIILSFCYEFFTK